MNVSASGLAERLGHPADAKLLIISCDDLGSCHAANEGVYAALRDGVATCASIMVPAPWARHAALRLRRPTTSACTSRSTASTTPTAGGRSRTRRRCCRARAASRATSTDLWEHADPEEVLRECRAQIERALAWGIDVTHLAPHLTAITLRPEFFDVYMELAVEFRLPIRLPSTITAEQAGFPFRQLAADEGVVFPDHFDHDWRAGSRDRVYDAIRSLQPGVTEVHVQPAIDTPEVRAITPRPGWIDDLRARSPIDATARASCSPPAARC